MRPIDLPRGRPCDPTGRGPTLAGLWSERGAPGGAGMVLRSILLACACAVLAICVLEVDVIAVADGKLVPRRALNVVQPAESGVVREILVDEGAVVAEGQVLIRMDAGIADAELAILEADLSRARMDLRRLDAELGGGELAATPEVPTSLYGAAVARLAARRRAHADALAAERAGLARAERDLAAARAGAARLERTLPLVREQAQAWSRLVAEGYAGRMMALDRERVRIETEQDLVARRAAVEALEASVDAARSRVAQLVSGHRRQLLDERAHAAAIGERLAQELAKQRHRRRRLALRSPAAGVVKDLATRTPGTVVAPGTVLATVVPTGEPLTAEVWIRNADVGLVREGAHARLKFAAFPFQRFGMLDGTVRHVSADASEPAKSAPGHVAGALSYRALVSLGEEALIADGVRHRLAPGMQVRAEMVLGRRTVLEYMLSPVRKTVHESWREP